MDLRIQDQTATAVERQAVDAVLGEPDTGWVGAARSEADGHFARGGHAARSQRHLLLPTLHAVQARAGWISPGALGYICRRLTIPPAEAYGVASFYALFALEPRPPVVAHVCTDIACMCRGSQMLVAELERTVGPAGEHPGNGHAIWLESPCLGLCERAPAVLLTEAGEDPSERSIAPATAADVAAALAGKLPERMVPEPVAQQNSPDVRLMRRFGVTDPESLDSYRSHGGYDALRRAFALGPMGVIREVSDSRLLGRGGAAFPTGRKWEAVARQPVRPHYLICNADESEPGTFKDRIVFEQDPFSVIEAMTIAAFATGCEYGYVYLRGEYPLAWERLVNAVTVARRHGFLGDDIMGQGMRFDIELRKGAGAYICGEETALFNSIEGFRGEPRNKPPFPVDAGLFRQADGHQQRRDARERARHRPRGRGRVRGARHRELDRHAPVLPLRLRGAAGAVRGAVRHHACARCSTWPAASAPGTSCGRCCSAARRARSSAPTCSTSSSRSRPHGRPA